MVIWTQCVLGQPARLNAATTSQVHFTACCRAIVGAEVQGPRFLIAHEYDMMHTGASGCVDLVWGHDFLSCGLTYVCVCGPQKPTLPHPATEAQGWLLHNWLLSLVLRLMPPLLVSKFRHHWTCKLNLYIPASILPR